MPGRLAGWTVVFGAGSGPACADVLVGGGLCRGGIRLGVEHPEIWVTVESEDF